MVVEGEECLLLLHPATGMLNKAVLNSLTIHDSVHKITIFNP